jgi:hypothetical protein
MQTQRHRLTIDEAEGNSPAGFEGDKGDKLGTDDAEVLVSVCEEPLTDVDEEEAADVIRGSCGVRKGTGGGETAMPAFCAS